MYFTLWFHQGCRPAAVLSLFTLTEAPDRSSMETFSSCLTLTQIPCHKCPEWRRLQAQKQIFPFLVIPNPLYTSPPTPEPSLSSPVPALQASHLSQSNYRIIDWRAINSPSLFTIPPPHLLICSQTGKSKKALGVTHLIPLGFLYSLQINSGTGTKGLFLPAVLFCLAACLQALALPDSISHASKSSSY